MAYQDSLCHVRYVGYRQLENVHWWVLVMLHDYYFNTHSVQRESASKVIKKLNRERRRLERAGHGAAGG